MAISLHLVWRKDHFGPAGSGDPSLHPKLSDIATQITRLRLFCYNISLFTQNVICAKVKLYKYFQMYNTYHFHAPFLLCNWQAHHLSTHFTIRNVHHFNVDLLTTSMFNSVILKYSYWHCHAGVLATSKLPLLRWGTHHFQASIATLRYSTLPSFHCYAGVLTTFILTLPWWATLHFQASIVTLGYSPCPSFHCQAGVLTTSQLPLPCWGTHHFQASIATMGYSPLPASIAMMGTHHFHTDIAMMGYSPLPSFHCHTWV